MSRNLHNLAVYSDRMAKGDYDAVYEYFAEKFMSHVTERVVPERVGTAILRFEDGKVVEHWGGPHCMKGVGLVKEA